MKNIKILPQEVINFIAAGEIIEKPASIVKELLENSIDSKTNHIVLKINNNNENIEIIVEDKGVGIDPDDLTHVFTQHATSKAFSIDEIINIETMGFRGEALWAIGNISIVEIITHYNEKKYKIICKFGVISAVESLGETNELGTIIKVTNIFDNLPVRKKFLKEFNTEYNSIKKIWEEESFCNPNVGFSLYLNKNIIESYPIGSPLGRLESINKNINNFYYNNSTNNKYSGFLIISDKKGKFFIGLNGRPIEDYKIKNFIKIQLEKKINKPVSVLSGGLYLTVPPEEVDINIHPRKQQAKFKDSQQIFDLLKIIFNNLNTPDIINNNEKIVNDNSTNINKNFYIPKSVFHVKDSVITKPNGHKENPFSSYQNFHFFNHNFLFITNKKQIVIVNKNLLNQENTVKDRPFSSKIITLPVPLLSNSKNWHQYNIKFSIVSENSIIAWDIPHNYSKSLEEFFKELQQQWNEKNLNNWLKQFNQWNDEAIIDYVMNNKIDNNWPLNYCSYIVNIIETSQE